MYRAFFIILTTAACLAGAESYGEAYRPQFHFSPKVNWTNDPCGLVYFGGQYHLFFQHNPFGDLWGHMSWGHGATPDLVRWAQLPVAIPEGEDAMIFTGSSVVDTNNSSGLCAPATACIVSIYTGHTPKTDGKPQRQTQNLASGQDGRTWKKYAGNPVLDLQMADFRDPKVFWHAPSKQWIMVAVLPAEKKARLFASANLKTWTHLSDFGPAGAVGGVWECPDLFELPVDGDSERKRWVLKIGLNPGHIAGGSGEQYFVGQFDGTRFRNERAVKDPLWLDYGRDCYCALTWNGEPDHQTHMIGWMSNWQYARDMPTSPWRGAMTLPRSLELHTSPDGVRLAQSPIAAMTGLRAEAFTYEGKQVAELNSKMVQWPHRSQTFEMLATIRPGKAKRIAWKILEGPEEYTLVGYDTVARRLFVDRTRSANTAFNPKFPSRTEAPLEIGTEPLELHIFVDRSSIEVFSGHGQTVLTNLVFPKPDSTGISMAIEGGQVDGVRLNLWKLRSAWISLQEAK
jgi:fructan beta-fructosidase